MPQLTILHRVASIPLVYDSLATLHSTLTNNSYTRSPYSAAQALSGHAYRVSEPIQIRLAPVIARADGIVNKAVDVVESRYPYPFRTPTAEIYNDLRHNSGYAAGVATKTLDDKIKSPAYGLAQGIDQRFAPVVDRMEDVVHKLSGVKQPIESISSDAANDHSPKQFQYQRAYRLSLDLKDSVYVYSSEHVKRIQEHNVLIQRATATARTVTETLASSYVSAQARVQALSDAMLRELQRLHASSAALPGDAHGSFTGLADGVAAAVGELSGIIAADLPVNEKVSRLRTTLEGRVQPLLEGASAAVQEALRAVARKTEATQNKAAEKTDERHGEHHLEGNENGAAT